MRSDPKLNAKDALATGRRVVVAWASRRAAARAGGRGGGEEGEEPEPEAAGPHARPADVGSPAPYLVEEPAAEPAAEEGAEQGVPPFSYQV